MNGSVKIIFLVALLFSGAARAESPIFPGQAEPEISEGILGAFGHALRRDYRDAEKICRELGRNFPGSPAGPTGEMILYQVMMLENDDYQLDREFRDAAGRATERARTFAGTALQNDWYYTLLGATWGVRGIYHLRRDEYLEGLYYGFNGLRYMQQAAELSPHNWEARMGIGLYLYYRSAYASEIGIPWMDRREEGINMVKAAGLNRPYLNEISRIAMYYIRLNEKDYGGARKYMDELIAQRPDFVIFYMLAGRAMLAAEDYQSAYDYFAKMHQIDRGLYLPPYRLAECSMALGRTDEAMEWLEMFSATPGARASRYYPEYERRKSEN